MPKRDTRITEYIKVCAPFARPILRHLRRVIHEGTPGLEETLKWGMPSFLYVGRIVCGFGGFKAHCALWFWKGEAVVGKKLQGAMGSFGRIETLADLPSDAELRTYVKRGVERIEQHH